MNRLRIGVVLAVSIALGACSGKPAGKPVAAAPAPPKPMSYELRLGRATFRHYCQTCHGETGAGDGFNAFNLDPHPRDLSDPAFQKKKTDADLADAIQRGGAGVGLSSMMPPWGRTLSKEQVEQVVLYVRSLAKH
jgi:mono/diheme cytochrome c family protein